MQDLCRGGLSSAQRDFQRTFDLLFLLRQNRVASQTNWPRKPRESRSSQPKPPLTAVFITGSLP